MRVIVTGGGTAGHVTPLLAVISELNAQSPESQIRYVGQVSDPFAKLLDNQKGVERRYSVLAGKWRRYHGIGIGGHLKDVKTLLFNLRDLIFFIIGFLQSLVTLIIWRPDVVFVKGGFVGLPVGLAAALLRINIVTHDSDSLPGLTNRILSRFATAQAVALPVENYGRYYSAKKLHFTGIPIKREFFDLTDIEAKQASREKIGVSLDSKVVLVVGGSLGAVRLNEAVLGNLTRLMEVPKLNILWVTGNNHYDQLKAEAERAGYPKDRVMMYPMTQELENLVSAADIVVSRAGATTIAEFAAAKKPIILVPNPFLTGGHQVKNAIALKDSGSALVITEEEISNNQTILAEQIVNLLSDENLSNSLALSLNKLAIPDAARRIVAVLKEVSER